MQGCFGMRPAFALTFIWLLLARAIALAQTTVDPKEALSPLVFQVSYYKQVNLDLAGLSDAAAQANWLATGVTQGRRAHPLFWSKQYVAYYPDLRMAYGSDYYELLQHYVDHGHAEGRTGVLALASEAFDIAYYKATNKAQTSLSDADAETYWVLTGIAAGQQAHPRFLASDYLFLNYDKVLAFGANGLAAAVDDYPLNGAPLNKLALVAFAPQVFDPIYYSAHHPEAQNDPATFWLSTGIARGDKASTLFSTVEYLGQYADLVTAYGAKGYSAALRHYVLNGRSEGRSGLYSIDQNYLSLVPTSAGLTTRPGDRLDQFTSVTGKTVTVTIQAPNPASNKVFTMRAIGASETADAYFPAAVKSALAANAGTLLIPMGTYNFAGGTSNVHWELDNVTDLTIDGQGSTLNFSQPYYGILMNAPTRLLIRNFTIDWPKLRVAGLGTVIAGPNGMNQLQMSSAYPFDGTVPVQALTPWDVAGNHFSRTNDNEVYYPPSSTTVPVYRGNNIYTSTDFAGYSVGTALLVRYYLVAAAVAVSQAQDLSFENVNILTSPSIAFFFAFGRGVRISNCSVERAPGRLISSVADAVHFNDFTGDVLVENSTFAHQGDDGMNLGTGSLLPVTAIKGTSVQFSPSDFVPNVGDKMLFYNSGLGILGTAKVVTVSQAADGTISVQLDQAVAHAANDSWAEDLNLMAARWIVRNNNFVENRARAILPQSPYGYIQGNTMSGQTFTSMLIGTINDLAPAAGPGVQDLQVLDNHILNAGDAASAEQGAIQISSWLTNGLYDESGSTDASVNQNIMLLRNVIENVPGPGIFLGSAANVTLGANQISNSNSGASYLLGTASTAGAIVVSQSHNVSIYETVLSGLKTGNVQVDSHSTSGVTMTVPTASALPLITAAANAASFSVSGAPGSIFTLGGSGLAGVGVTAGASAVPLPLSLAGVSATVNGRPAPLLYVSPTQINLQLPYEAIPGSGTVTVTNGGAITPAFPITVAAAAPGVFVYDTNRAVAQNPDGTLNGPGHPVAGGSYLVVYLTGQGALDQAVATGAAAPSSPLSRATQPFSATINGQSTAVLFLGLAPGFVGVAQANVVVPKLAKGDYPLSLVVGGAASAPVMVSVGP